jgi:hypothetical protein
VNAPGYARIRRHIETRILRRRRPPAPANRPIRRNSLIASRNLNQTPPAACRSGIRIPQRPRRLAPNPTAPPKKATKTPLWKSQSQGKSLYFKANNQLIFNNIGHIQNSPWTRFTLAACYQWDRRKLPNMSTEKLTRSEQARVNGAKSRGPKTEDGRMKIADANTTHGLYRTSASVLSIESAQAFNHLRDAAFAQYRPRTIFEAQLVEEIVDCSWRINRLRLSATVEGNTAIEELRQGATQPIRSVRAVTHAELNGSKPQGPQTLIQRRVSALISDRSRIADELRRLQNFPTVDITQEPLETNDLTPGT